MEIRVEIKQQQTLTPQMLLNIRLLQYNMQELYAFSNEALAENPLLESADPEQAEALPPVFSHVPPPFDRQNFFYESQDAEDAEDPLLRIRAPENGETLADHLKAQIDLLHLPEAQKQAARVVAELLDVDGYLAYDPSALRLMLHTDGAEAEKALALVRTLEPAGVGAHDLADCLLLQLVRLPDTALAQRIARDHLGDVAKRRFNHIAKLCQADAAEVKTAVERIRALEPRPGASFFAGDTVGYVYPDFLVSESGDGFSVALNDNYVPRLRINDYYASLRGATDDAETRRYLCERYRLATQVMRAIEQRRTTLVRCCARVVEIQTPFFAERGALVPMTLHDVADALGVHESTVSRAMHGKYLQCRWGVFPMSRFFSRAIAENSSASAGVSPDAAKRALSALIEKENKAAPYSDQKLSELLSGSGFALSRRTVAKYRDELRFPPASGRKI